MIDATFVFAFFVVFLFSVSLGSVYVMRDVGERTPWWVYAGNIFFILAGLAVLVSYCYTIN